MRVLFVCSGNAYRSPIAEALLKKLRPDLDVDSAGTDAATQISDEARKYLKIENTEHYIKEKPEGIDSKQLNDYDSIIAMEPQHRDVILNECPECARKITIWNIDDPYFLPHGYADIVFRQIKNKVLDLARSL